MASRWTWSPGRVLAPIDPNTPRHNEASIDGSTQGGKLPSVKSFGLSKAPKPVSQTKGITNTNTGSAVQLPKPTAAASRKRKSDALDGGASHLFPQHVPEIDDDDPRLNMSPKDTCNAVRRKIRDWTTSGAQKVGEFQNEIGVSSKGYSNFMNRSGTWDGEGCDTYHKAFEFFKKRELQGLPLKKTTTAAKQAPAGKKAVKAQADELLDVSSVDLPGEETGSVPVFETCDEVRKKLRAFLAKDGVTNAAFAREITKTFVTDGEEARGNVTGATLNRFLGLKGPRAGNTTTAFYASYVFFEKRRIIDGKPKSALRVDMEDVHGAKGLDVKHNSNTSYICFAGEGVTVDKYGALHVIKTRR